MLSSFLQRGRIILLHCNNKPVISRLQAMASTRDSGDYERYPEMTDAERYEALNKIPGPAGYYFIGNAMQMDSKHQHTWVHEQVLQHGPIMKFKLFQEYTVVISSQELAKEAMLKRGIDFRGRPQWNRILALMGDGMAFAMKTAEHYPPLRACMVKGMAQTNQLPETLHNRMKMIADTTSKFAMSGEFDLGQMVSECAHQCLTSMMFGGIYEYDDPETQAIYQFNAAVTNVFRENPMGIVLDLIPSLFQYKWILRSVHNSLEASNKYLTKLANVQIEKSKKRHDKSLKCVIDHFLKKQAVDKEATGYTLVTDASLKSIFIDFASGSLPSVTAYLIQAFSTLLVHPELQERLHADIDKSFNEHDVITDSDRAKLPIVEAFLLENFRYSLFLPHGFFHATEYDTELGGYKIPKGVRVIHNFFTILRNPEVFEDPDSFKADRYLDSSGAVISEDDPVREQLTLWGIGVRRCPGQSFAQQMIFEMFTHVMQHYRLELVGPAPDIDIRNMECTIAIKIPYTVNVKFVRRH